MRNNKMAQQISAFTLAEVLITLTVIGVVASLTIPSLINNLNNSSNVAQLKKAYANLFEAYKLVAIDNGGIESVFSGDGSASADANVMNTFAAKFNIVKNCGSGMGCWYSTEQKTLDGSIYSPNFDNSFNNNYGKAILADGSMLLMNDSTGNCNIDSGDGPLDGSVCGSVQIDINGEKGPNTRGRDYFVFWITKTGIFPLGSYNDGYSCGSGNNIFTSDGCTAKILQEGAMNY